MEENNENNELSNETEKLEEEPIYQEVETKKKEIRTDSYFDGGVLELIGWRILAFLITIVTLGIAAPWAQCMLYSWQIKHTVYNGKRLKFEGTGGDLFVNIFKWIFFSIITLGIYIFFIPVRKARWVVSNIHFEDEELVKDESFFDGNTLQLIGINILSYIITIFSLGLLYPFAVCLKLKWINKHTVINKKKIVFDGNGIQLWGKYLLWYLLTIITLGIFLIWQPILMLKWQTKHIHIKKVGEEEKKDYSLLIVIPIAIALVIAVSCALNNVFSKMSKADWEEFASEILNKVEINENVFKLNKNTNNEYGIVAVDNSKKYIEESNISAETEIASTPAKTSINVGGYSLKFGTYKGQIEQGVWDEETMTPTSRFTNVVLVLNEKNITVDGQTSSYSISGNNIIWNGNRYLLEVTGNNKIRYNVETCPELLYQGY